jgi:hypothetical protein
MDVKKPQLSGAGLSAALGMLSTFFQIYTDYLTLSKSIFTMFKINTLATHAYQRFYVRQVTFICLCACRTFEVNHH